jgi:hypothetical protein
MLLFVILYNTHIKENFETVTTSPSRVTTTSSRVTTTSPRQITTTSPSRFTTPRSITNHSVTRQDFIINGKTYNGTHKTPCFNKSDDFNEWCRNYIDQSNISVASGNNINNIGAKNIIVGELNGTDEDCGNPNFAQAICDFNYIDGVSKIQPNKKCNSIYQKNGSNNCSDLNYNIFTDCLHPTSTLQDYKDQCTSLGSKLSTESTETYSPVEFSGYDCNPGYFRAKCINSSDTTNLSTSSNLDNLFSILGGNNYPPQEKCNNNDCPNNRNNCNCSNTNTTTTPNPR